VTKAPLRLKRGQKEQAYAFFALESSEKSTVRQLKGSQCGVIRVADFRGKVNAREQRFEVRVNKIGER
jgi:hypothetical protein